jgi:AbrB family looped-hinge helix DNA binding protein
METTIDRFGRVVIPKDVREQLDLDAGAVLEVERHDHEIRLKPVRAQPDVVVEEGVLVFSGAAMGDLADALRLHRGQRIKAVSRRTAR